MKNTTRFMQPTRIRIARVKEVEFIRPNDLARRLNVSVITLWRMEKRNQLPPKRRISANVTGWLSNEIDEWLRSTPTIASIS